MRVDLEPREQAAVDRALVFAREVITPKAPAWERIPSPRDVIALAADAGLCGLLAPRGLGGCALGLTAMARVMEELAAADFGVAFSLVVHNNLVGAICRDGSTHQVERFVPDLVAGRRVGAFLLTEPNAGSDAAALTTTATPQSGGWRLDGVKAWVTNAVGADVLNVFAQTDPSIGSRGIASFLVDAGGGWLVQQRDLTPEWLANLLRTVDRPQLLARAVAARKMRKVTATQEVVGACEALTK